MVFLGAVCVLFASLWSLSLGTPVGRSMQIHEVRQVIPNDFTLAGPAPLEATLDMRIALVQNNISGLINALHDVSDPARENYGKHLTKAEVSDFRHSHNRD